MDTMSRAIGRVPASVASGLDMRSDRLLYETWESGGFAWTGGFWSDRFDKLLSSTIPSMRDALNDPENATFLANFKRAAGLEEGEFVGVDWSDGDCYKYIESLCYAYKLSGDKSLIDEVDQWVSIIAKAQMPDGYIGTQTQLTGRERWSKKVMHELYNFGHLFTAAVVHFKLCGNDRFLNIATKAADYLYSIFGDKPVEFTHLGWNPSQIMGLIDLYRCTGECRYRDLAKIFVEMRGSDPGGKVGTHVFQQGSQRDIGDQNQDRVPLKEENEAVGHAVTAMYLYSGATDVYRETGDADFLRALDRIWVDVVERKMYITGAVGATHHNVSKRGDVVYEAFNVEYKLPNATAYNETCANIANAMWNWRLLQLHGEVRFADVMETVLYNSALSAVSMDGSLFTYTNPLRWYGKEQLLLNNDRPGRWKTHKCYCCPPQVARAIGWLYQWMISKSVGAIWVHLFGSFRQRILLDGIGEVSLRMETDYPWDEDINIVLEETPNCEYAIRIRIPSWADETDVYVNQHVVERPRAGEYLEIKRTWVKGDTVRIRLNMKPRIVIGHERIEETRNQGCVARGPIVYCLESVDLPDEVRLSSVYLKRDGKLKASFDQSLLGGVGLVWADGRIEEASEMDGDVLYRTLSPSNFVEQRLKLIPYYAWHNRGETEMSVWFPLV